MLAPSTVPGEKLPTSQRKASDGNKDVWKCRSSRDGKDFLTCIQCTTVFPICMTWTEFPGTDNGHNVTSRPL